MRSLGDADILTVWETAHRYHPVDQALALLVTAEPEHSRDELASLPLGRRDARLLALRLATFGDSLNSRASCPQCNEAVEFEIACSQLHSPDLVVHERTLDTDGYQLRLRPLTSFDLAAAAGAADVAEARQILLKRCVVVAHRSDALVNADELPETISAAAAQAALELDPQAELLFELTCPACDHRWQATLDIAHILWQEVNARAQRLLMEVHLLARAYGWREADILGMSSARRYAYLERVAA
jgi:hypothetical protein